MRCEPGVDCLAGHCGGGLDGGLDGADADQAAPSDADGSGLDGADADGPGGDGPTDAHDDDSDVASDGCGPGGCEDADASGTETGDDGSQGDADGDTCVPPYDNPLNCGSCGFVCPSSTPVCEPVGDGGVSCSPFCHPPLTDCGGSCKDLQTDEHHCGACNKKCITGLCFDGKCVGGGAGNVVFMGMNFHVWFPGAPPTRLLGNAVFLPSHNPVRMLSWTQYADDSPGGPVGSITELIAWYSSQIGRPYALTDGGTDTNLPTLLNPAQVDVLLVLDQPKAPAGELASIGAAWSQPVSDFVHAGGTIVVLMSTQGQNEMPQFVNSAGLGTLASLKDITVPSHILANVAPFDAVGVNVFSPFLARPETAMLQTTMTPGGDTIFVVVDNTNPDAGPLAPVVIHKVVLP